MRKLLIIALFLGITANAFCQDLVVSYGVSTDGLLDKEQKERLSEDVKKIYTEAQENFKHILFKLKVKESESIFFREEKLNNDGNKKFKIATAMAGFKGVFYANSREKEKIYKWDGYGQEFLITSEFNSLDWEITKESKLIKGLKAYKAQTIEEYFDGKEYKKWEIVAWFTPEINKPFGPGGYGGLPGLILELKRGSKIYFVKDLETIALDVSEFSKPKEGKIVTQEEFDEIGREMTKKLREF